MRRKGGNLARYRASSCQGFSHGVNRLSASAYFNQYCVYSSDLIPKKAVCRAFDYDDILVGWVLAHLPLVNPPHRAAFSRVSCRDSPKVADPGQATGRLYHRRKVQGFCHAVMGVAKQRRWRRPIQDAVLVDPTGGAAPCVKPVRNRIDPDRSDCIRQVMIHGPQKHVGSVRLIRDEIHHLTTGVCPRIGPTRPPDSGCCTR